jgi:hypothetical protein
MQILINGFILTVFYEDSRMKIQRLLKVIVGFGVLIMGYSVTAAPVVTYQASLVADCSNLNNCPLLNGDVLWNDEVSRSGLALDNAMLLIGKSTQTKIDYLTKNLQEFYLIKGSLVLRVWETRPWQIYRLKTGNIMVSIRQSGYFRMDVSPNGQDTTIRVMEGRADIRIGNIVQIIKKGETFRYIDNQSPVYSRLNVRFDDDQYYFSQNFMSSYYEKYPIRAPRHRVMTKSVVGPRVEIMTVERPVVIYEQPARTYRRPLIIRDSRYQGNDPLFHIDVNFNSRSKDRHKHEESVKTFEKFPDKQKAGSTTVTTIPAPKGKNGGQKGASVSEVKTPAPIEKTGDQNTTSASEITTPVPNEKPVEQKVAPTSEQSSSGSSDKAVDQNAAPASEETTSATSEESSQQKVVPVPDQKSSESSEKSNEQKAVPAPDRRSPESSEKSGEKNPKPAPDVKPQAPNEKPIVKKEAPVLEVKTPTPEPEVIQPRQVEKTIQVKELPVMQKEISAPSVQIEVKPTPASEVAAPIEYKPVPVPQPKAKLKVPEMEEDNPRDNK